jgi:hypothetical protein
LRGGLENGFTAPPYPEHIAVIDARRTIDQFRCDRAQKGRCRQCPVILRYETS